MISYKNTSRFLTAFAVLTLTSCGYAIETSNQEITVLTPGAQNAYCDVFVEKLRYQVYPPQTISIIKAKADMKVKCTAPGNRKSEMTVPSKMSTKAVWGSPAGMAWDYASQSLYQYPSVIAVDFSQTSVIPEEMPKHNASDIQSPDKHYLEEITPSVPRLNADKNKPAVVPLRREGASPLPVATPPAGSAVSSTAAVSAQAAGAGSVTPLPPSVDPVVPEATKKITSDAAKKESTNAAPPENNEKGSLMSIIERLGGESKKVPAAESPESESEPKEISAPYPVNGEAESAPVPITPQ